MGALGGAASGAASGAIQWGIGNRYTSKYFPCDKGTNNGESGSIDYYVGSNGKALPSQYKNWIGTNMQEELLRQAENPQLQNAIKQLYRGKSFIGDGGTADVIRFEQETGITLGKNGGSHIQKRYRYGKLFAK